jgi:hypothetical protein
MTTFDIVNNETGEILFSTDVINLAMEEISFRGWTVTEIKSYIDGTFIYVNCNR